MLEKTNKEELIQHFRMIEDKKSDGLPKTAKFKYKVLVRLNNQYPIARLCHVLRCFRNGYYSWIKLGRQEFKSFKPTSPRLCILRAPYKEYDGYGLT